MLWKKQNQRSTHSDHRCATPMQHQRLLRSACAPSTPTGRCHCRMCAAPMLRMCKQGAARPQLRRSQAGAACRPRLRRASAAGWPYWPPLAPLSRSGTPRPSLPASHAQPKRLQMITRKATFAWLQMDRAPARTPPSMQKGQETRIVQGNQQAGVHRPALFSLHADVWPPRKTSIKAHGWQGFQAHTSGQAHPAQPLRPGQCHAGRQQQRLHVARQGPARQTLSPVQIQQHLVWVLQQLHFWLSGFGLPKRQARGPVMFCKSQNAFTGCRFLC